MAVFRVHKTKDYTVLSNYHFKDKTLSLKAKGLLSLMLSLPDDWDYSIRGLQSLSKDGVESTSSALRELEAHQYLCRTRVTENGRFAGYDYDVYEEPQLFSRSKTEKPYTENPYTEKSDREIPDMEKSYTDKTDTDVTDTLNSYLSHPDTENTLQLNTKEIKDILINNEDDDNNNSKQIREKLDWFLSWWNHLPHVTQVRGIMPNTKRYQECCVVLSRYTQAELEEAGRNMIQSTYLKEKHPTLDWFVDTNRNVIEKLLENAYTDWSMHDTKKKALQYNQRDYDYSQLEDILFNNWEKNQS